MGKLVIQGQNRLEGKLSVHGSKNSVLPILAATMIGRGQSVIENCPDLSDTAAACDILRQLGCSVWLENGAAIVENGGYGSNKIPEKLMRKMRSSVMFLGAILSRDGSAVISFPGGCELGPRPIDLHMSALSQMGVKFREEGGYLYCTCPRGLQGADVTLSIPSVGATENVMLAAVCAKGDTVIVNAAREPEIEDLQRFLCAAGAKISGAGTPEIAVAGFAPRAVTEHRVMPDRIAAATYLCAAAAAGGDVLLTDAVPAHIETVCAALRQMGCAVVAGSSSVRLRRSGAMRACRPVVTKPYPGFPTDAQALLMAASLRADGTSVFVENIFENRFRHVAELRRLGADIRTEGRVAMVTGVRRLTGAPLTACDLRGGAAMVVAALAAEGESTVRDSGHIERGYDRLAETLRALGADVRRE